MLFLGLVFFVVVVLPMLAYNRNKKRVRHVRPITNEDLDF